MRNIITRLALLALFTPMALAAAPKVNSLSQINWPPVTGSGAPGGTCASSNYGQPYTNTTNGNFYVCSSSGWVLVTGGGGGSVSGQAINVVGLATGASTTGAQSHINEATPGITQITQETDIADGSGNAGYAALGGATGTATVKANTAGFMAPSSASFTAYALQFPSTGPTNSLPLLSCATPTSGVSACSFVSSSAVRQWTCQPGLGDGANAISAGTYLQTGCLNTTGSTITLTGFQCYSDNNGTSSANVTNGSGTSLLTGAITCTTSFASGTQSGTTTLASGDFLKWTFVADGTTTQSTWVVKGTY